MEVMSIIFAKKKQQLCSSHVMTSLSTQAWYTYPHQHLWCLLKSANILKEKQNPRFYFKCILSCVCNSVKASQYLVPDSVPVQRNDNHRRVWEEALVVERQISSLPSHIQHVSNPNRNINSMQSRKFDFCFLEIRICIFIHTDACTYNDHLLIKSKAPPGSLI